MSSEPDFRGQSATCGQHHSSRWSPTQSLPNGAYAREDKPLDAELDHLGTPARMAVLRDVAKDSGATVNQVVLAWLIGAAVPMIPLAGAAVPMIPLAGAAVPMIPLVGASSVTQLDESLAAVDLELTAEQRARPDAAR